MGPLWASWPIGTRVVIRYRLPGGGLSDALGDLTHADDEAAVVATRRGEVRVPASAAVVGKPVPPPPPPRRPREDAAGHSPPGGGPHTTRSQGM